MLLLRRKLKNTLIAERSDVASTRPEIIKQTQVSLTLKVLVTTIDALRHFETG